MASESIAHLASWAIDSEPIRARGIIVKYTLVPKGFLECGRNFRCWPKADTSSAVPETALETSAAPRILRKVCDSSFCLVPLQPMYAHFVG